MPLPKDYDTAMQYWEDRHKKQGADYVGKRGKSLEDQTTKIRKILHEQLAGSRYKRALDYGCGWGRMTPLLNEYADETLGVDILDHFKTEGPGLSFQKLGKPLRINVPDNYFDLVYSGLCLQHIIAEKWYMEAVNEIKRVTAPGAKVIIIDDVSSTASHVRPRDPNHIAACLGVAPASIRSRLVTVDPTPKTHNLLTGRRQHGQSRAIWFLATDDYLPYLRCLISTLKKYGGLRDRLILFALGNCQQQRLDWFKKARVEVIKREAKGGRHRGGLRWKWHKTQIFNEYPELTDTLYLDCDLVITDDISEIWEHAPQVGEVASIPWSQRPHGDPFSLNHARAFYKMGYKCFRTGVMLYRRGLSDHFLRTWGEVISVKWPIRASAMDQPQLYKMLYDTGGSMKIRPIPDVYDFDVKNGKILRSAEHKIVHYHKIIPQTLPQFDWLRQRGFVDEKGNPGGVKF